MRPTRTVLNGGVRIHLGRGRGEHDVDALGLTRADIGVERARIAVEIVLAIELQRIDEDADDDDVAFARRACAHQPRVARVQRAHRRHEADASGRRGAPAASRARSRSMRSITATAISFSVTSQVVCWRATRRRTVGGVGDAARILAAADVVDVLARGRGDGLAKVRRTA